MAFFDLTKLTSIFVLPIFSVTALQAAATSQFPQVMNITQGVETASTQGWLAQRVGESRCAKQDTYIYETPALQRTRGILSQNTSVALAEFEGRNGSIAIRLINDPRTIGYVLKNDLKDCNSPTPSRPSVEQRCTASRPVEVYSNPRGSLIGELPSGQSLIWTGEWLRAGNLVWAKMRSPIQGWIVGSMDGITNIYCP